MDFITIIALIVASMLKYSAPITKSPSRPTFTIPPRSEKVPPILVKINGAEYFNIRYWVRPRHKSEKAKGGQN